MSSPRLFVLSAPSGSGKTTIAREILKRHPEIHFSVSATTRAKRGKEIDGIDYFFVDAEEFKRRIRDHELIEWEEIYGDYYGSPRSEVDNSFRDGKSVLFDIDVKGALAIKKQYPRDAVLIFIEPPSMEILIRRLTDRKTEDEAKIRKRLERTQMELEMGKEFEFHVLNDTLQTAVDNVDAIVRKMLTAGNPAVRV
ncbi:MAG TPA: guanylate kinase [Bacteroidota bacterium]|nr:guanylate kinase [Bacteroidota bacterium]